MAFLRHDPPSVPTPVGGYLTDRDQADANGRIRREVLPAGTRPALTVLVAQTLESPWLLEIEAIAAR